MALYESSIFIAVLKLFVSPCGCQRADSFFSVWNFNRFGKNGGPDRTRTYDPRLIKAVL
jgi:hypothetical protein